MKNKLNIQKLLIIHILFASIFFLSFCNNNSSEQNFDNLLKDTKKAISESNFETAYSNLNSLIEISKKTNQNNQKIKINILLGDFYLKFGENNQALKYYLISYELAKKSSDKLLLSEIYTKLGNIYLQNNKLAESLQYYRKSYELSRFQKNIDREIEVLMNIGLIKDKMNQMDSAYYFYHKILKITDANSLNSKLPELYNDLGNLYFKQSLYNEAKLLYNKAIDTSLTYGNKDNLGLYLFNLGKTYSGLQQYDSAKITFDKAAGVLVENKNHKLLAECNYWIAKNELLRNSNKELITYLEKSRLWVDSVIFEKNNNWHNTIQNNFKISQKESEIHLLETKNYYQRLIFAILLIITIVFVIFIYFFLKNRNKKLQQRNKILSQEKEILALKKQQEQAEKERLNQKFEKERLIRENELKQKELDLEKKNREILSNAMLLNNKNELLVNIQNGLEQLEFSNPENKKVVSDIISKLKGVDNQESVWSEFKIHFENVHKNFFEELQNKHPELSQNDLRLAAYILIGLQNKEIANILFISPDSVRKRKQRLREKLNLSNNDLYEYLKSME